MSVFQRLAIVGFVAAGIAGAASSAEAQYYYQQSPYGYQQPAPYVSPKILRKQRQLEQRVYEKYGYPQQRHRNSYDHGYQQPQYYPQQQYRQPRYVQPQYQQPRYQQPRYQQAYPQQLYQQRQNDLPLIYHPQ
jgi:hypothetical protein